MLGEYSPVNVIIAPIPNAISIVGEGCLHNVATLGVLLIVRDDYVFHVLGLLRA